MIALRPSWKSRTCKHSQLYRGAGVPGKGKCRPNKRFDFKNTIWVGRKEAGLLQFSSLVKKVLGKNSHTGLQAEEQWQQSMRKFFLPSSLKIPRASIISMVLESSYWSRRLANAVRSHQAKRHQVLAS